MTEYAYKAKLIINSGAPLKIAGFTVKDGLFHQVFDNESAFNNYVKRNNCQLTDFANKAILPGQIDAHTIATFISRFVQSVSLKRVYDPVTLKTHIQKSALRELPEHGFAFFTNWSEELLPLDKEKLNEITQAPTAIFNSSYHGALLNELALKKLENENFFKDHQKPNNGILTGPPYDAFVLRTSPSPSEFAVNILLYEREMLAKGITTVHDMVVQKPEELKILATLSEKNMLKARWRVYVTNTTLLHDAPVPTDAFKLMGVKLFIDGSYGMKTAWQDKAHAYSDGKTGVQKLSAKDIVKTAQQAAELGFKHVAAHCIGYKACETFLDAVEELRRSIYTKEMVFRALHFQTVDKKLINRAQELKVFVSMQPGFSNDVYLFEKDIPIKPDINPMRDVAHALKEKFCLGSDSMPLGLLENAELCLTPPFESQKITDNFVKLLPYFTRNCARVTHEHNHLGAIKIGHSADFIITNQLPRSKNDLKNTFIEQTWCQGAQVYTKPEE